MNTPATSNRNLPLDSRPGISRDHDAGLAPPGTWVYFRYLPPKDQVAAVHAAGKKVIIGEATVSGNLPDAWKQAADAGVDGILTDYPLELRKALKDRSRP